MVEYCDKEIMDRTIGSITGMESHDEPPVI